MGMCFKVERARVTLLRCYSEVANQAPASALLPRLEDGLMDWLITQLSQAKVSPACCCVNIPVGRLRNKDVTEVSKENLK